MSPRFPAIRPIRRNRRSPFAGGQLLGALAMRLVVTSLGVLLAVALPAVDLGELELRADPGLEVVWEGTLLGQIDQQGMMRISGIPPGAYGIELRGGGRRSRELLVEVEAGDNQFVDPRAGATDLQPGLSGVALATAGGLTTVDLESGAAPSLGSAEHSISPGPGRGVRSLAGESPSLPLLIAVAVASVFALLIYFRDPRHFRRGAATVSAGAASAHRAGARGPVYGAGRVVEIVDVEVREVFDAPERQ